MVRITPFDGTLVNKLNSRSSANKNPFSTLILWIFNKKPQFSDKWNDSFARKSLSKNVHYNNGVTVCTCSNLQQKKNSDLQKFFHGNCNCNWNGWSIEIENQSIVHFSTNANWKTKQMTRWIIKLEGACHLLQWKKKSIYQ